jgi:integrase
MSLAAARDRARAVIEQAKSGSDPRRIAAEKRQQKIIERRTTFEAIAVLFMQRHVEPALRPNTAREYRRILQGPDTQHWHLRPLASLTRNDVLEVLQRIKERAPAAADRTLAYLSKFFSWCCEQDLIASCPTDRVRVGPALRARDRVHSDDELGWIWRGLDHYPGIFGSSFKATLLTGQRRGEVAGMRWDELRDLGGENALWSLPCERTKNGYPHLVPLTPAVQEIIAVLPRRGPYVFSTNDSSPVSGFSKAKSQLDSLVSDLRAQAGLEPLLPWTLHDLRRTMVTVMNERLGVMPHVVEAVVNHVSGPAKRGIAGVYNRALYLGERRAALVRWEAHVTHLRSYP